MTDLPDDFADRVRAARNYVGMNQAQFGAKFGRTGASIKNWEAGRTPKDELGRSELIRRLVEVSGLPEWFFTVPNLNRALQNRGPESVDGDLAQQIARVEAHLAELDGKLDRLAELEDRSRQILEAVWNADGKLDRIASKLAALRDPTQAINNLARLIGSTPGTGRQQKRPPGSQGRRAG